MTRTTILGSLVRRIIDKLCLLLDATEREVVYGDLAESGESGTLALRQVLGLVLRRLGSGLLNWRPWLIIIALSIPLGILVSLQSRRVADGRAIYLWLYTKNWDWAIIQNSGFWTELSQSAQSVLLSYLALACWSWTIGFVVASFSRRTLWFNGAVLFMAVLAASCFGIPRSLGSTLVLQRARDFSNNAAVFQDALYRQVFPVCLFVVLVGLPLLRGMVQGCRMGRFPRTAQVLLQIAALAGIGALVSSDLLWWQLRVWYIRPLHLPRLPSLMPMAVLTPLAYLLSTSLIRHRRLLKIRGSLSIRG